MILITGASGGVGRYLFQRYSESNETVFGTSFTSISDDERISKVDVRSFEQVDGWVRKIIEGRASSMTLIAAAGISFASMTHKADPLEWKNVVDVNLVGAFNAVRSVLPRMREERYGRIVLLSSVVARSGEAGTSAYAASKAGLWSFAKCLARENGGRGITANCLNLGYAEIGMGLRDIREDMREDLLARIPAGRFCYPDEILSVIEAFRSTAYLNGAAIDLNGGLI